jgi:hypothetical protein
LGNTPSRPKTQAKPRFYAKNGGEKSKVGKWILIPVYFRSENDDTGTPQGFFFEIKTRVGGEKNERLRPETTRNIPEKTRNDQKMTGKDMKKEGVK